MELKEKVARILHKARTKNMDRIAKAFGLRKCRITWDKECPEYKGQLLIEAEAILNQIKKDIDKSS